ncbi:MAG: helix-turn-helix domain-containing protein [Christensenella sp.]|nr:MAG: helix-turn-helix domain-containing protein [Christensenella sp.]
MRSNVDEQNVLLRTRLVELRKEKGLSQVALAKELGVDCSTIAKYETGDRLPDLVMLCKLADYFNVTTDYLVGRTPF